MSMMDNIHAMQRELEEMGVSPKSVEGRIAAAVAAERERWATAADNWATHYKAQDKEAKFLALNHFAAVIRTGAGEGDIDNPPVV